MQQTKSYWRVVAVAGVVGAFVASACVVTTSTDDGTGGLGGGTSAGGTAGTSATAAGTSGTVAGSTSVAGTSSSAGSTAAGGTGAVAFQCDPTTDDGGPPPGTPNTCVPDDAHKTDACALCIQSKCCTEYSQCYATAPGNQCGWGGPNNEGEIVCIQLCVQAATSDGGPDDADLRSMCYDSCATTVANHGSQECGLIGNQTNALFSCMSDNCATDCLGG